MEPLSTSMTAESPTCADLMGRKSSLDSLVIPRSKIATSSPQQLAQSRHLHIGDNIEDVLSAVPSPDAHDLPASENPSGQYAPVSPQMLSANPITTLSKSYVQLLRKHQMAHCEKKQVVYRLDAMSAESVCSFSKAMVEIIELFLDQCEEQQQSSAKHAAGELVTSDIAGRPFAENTDSARNEHGLLQPVHPYRPNGYSNKVSHSASHQSTPRGSRGGSHEDGRGLLSFASFMTTASIRSVDRQPIHETNQLRKSQDDDGNKTINRYSVLADLGKGAFGKVKLGVNNETNESVAIKIMKKSILKKSSDPLALKREIAILKKVRHQNIVSLYEVIDDPDSDKLYLVMQYVQNGPLVRVKNDFTCTPLSADSVKLYVKQLISAVRYLHKRHIIHHDIKPDNILLGTDGLLYLTDFGVSEMFSNEQSLTESTRRGVGTPIFQAPELLAMQHVSVDTDAGDLMETGTSLTASQPGKPRERGGSEAFDGIASDTWAIGVTTFLILVGRVPFSGRNYMEVVHAIQQQPIEWTGKNVLGQEIDPNWKEVVFGMLEKDPKKRWTLKRVKNHPIFTSEEADVVGKLTKASVMQFDLTPAEVFHATTTVNHFLEEDERATAFTTHASSLAKNYVSRLRKRVSMRTSATWVRPTQTEEAACCSNPSLSPNDKAPSPPGVPIAASPPRDLPSGRNPRKSMLSGEGRETSLDLEVEEPTPRFDDIFSVRRATVVGTRPANGDDDCE